jgi:hypothetical protein
MVLPWGMFLNSTTAEYRSQPQTLPQQDFEQILHNARAGLLPSSVEVELEHPIRDAEFPLKFSWEPDGSGLIWDNRSANGKRQGLKIEGVTLHYALSDGGKHSLKQNADVTQVPDTTVKKSIFGPIVGAVALIIFILIYIQYNMR